MTVFVRDPLVWLDNNRTERGLRGPVVGRRNHFGSKSARGTVVAATMYSLVESAKSPALIPSRISLRSRRSRNETPAPSCCPPISRPRRSGPCRRSGPPSGWLRRGVTIDVYTTFPWDALRREVAKFVIHRRSPDNLVELRAAIAAAGSRGDGPSDDGPFDPDPARPPIGPSPRNRGLSRSLATPAADSKGIRGTTSWRRRESNTGPARSQESAGARRRVVSGEESGICGAEGGVATVVEDGETSRRCSDVASLCSNGCSKGAANATAALEMVEEVIAELDAGRIDAAKARLKAFVAATRGGRGA